MVITRKIALFFIAFSLWNLFVWITFVKNVYPQHHFDMFFLVHLAIGLLTSIMGIVVGGIGIGALMRHRRE